MADEKTFTQAEIDKAVADAVGKVQASIDKLETKNEELVGELRTTKQELRKSKDIDPADLAKLEEENEKLRTDLTAAQKQAKDATAALEKAAKQIESETGFTSKLLTENALNTALAEAGVTDPVYLKAAKAMMAGTAQVVSEGEQRIVKIGDKALADYVKEWAATDEAKKLISAPGNSGGGAGGGRNGDPGKTMTRTEYNEKIVADPQGTKEFLKDGGKIVNEAA